MCDDCKYFVYNLRWYIYYTVHTCDIVSFCFCKAVSFCIIIYKLNYSSVSNKMFCSPTCMTTRTGFYSTKREKGVFLSDLVSLRWLLRWPRGLKTLRDGPTSQTLTEVSLSKAQIGSVIKGVCLNVLTQADDFLTWSEVCVPGSSYLVVKCQSEWHCGKWRL